MKKIWLFSIILLTGCTTILESLIESMNSETLAKYPVEDGKKIQSCEQLKKESFDFFYSNQKCLSDYGGRLKVQLKEINEKSPKIYTTGFVDEYTQNLQKYDECKISQNLTVKEVGYLKYVYFVCKDSTHFKEGDVKRIIADYEAISQFREQLHDPEIRYNLHHAQQEAAFNGKLQKILSTVDKDPVLKKLKQNAPDFMMAKLGGDDKCPLFLLFDTMSKEFSDSNSDLAFPQNYKFARKNANILEVSIGDIKLKFAKNRKNGVNTIYFRNVSSDGEVVTSKNTIQNNSFLQAICQGEEGMINLMLFYGALNNF